MRSDHAPLDHASGQVATFATVEEEPRGHVMFQLFRFHRTVRATYED